MNKFGSIILLISLIMICGCRERMNRLPNSTARPYEVILSSDSADTIRKALTTDVEGLPQPEPNFDVRTIKPANLKGNMLYARAIVIYSHDHDTICHYKLNVHAEPQIIIEANAHNIKSVIRYLQAFEAEQQVVQLRRHRNREMERMIRKKFGIQMTIPVEMTSSKVRKDFIWLSNNDALKMKNLCIMRINEPTTEAIDSMLAQNIKGETDAMYMQLTTATLHEEEEHHGEQHLYGLWDMKGDAMGGPFEARIVPQGNHYIAMLTFAYAPQTKKRNIMRQLHAVIYNKYITYGRKQ